MTIGSALAMGIGGGLLLSTVQAVLVDRHGEGRTVALTEANVAAGIAYLVLTGMLLLMALLHVNWRIAVLSSLAVPALTWVSNKRGTDRRANTVTCWTRPSARRVLDRVRHALLHNGG